MNTPRLFSQLIRPVSYRTFSDSGNVRGSRQAGGKSWSSAIGPLRPGKLAELTGRSVAPSASTLLPTADIVRYDTRSKQTRYWLKHKREISDLLNTLKKVYRVTAPLQ
jgi:hypothetical protein